MDQLVHTERVTKSDVNISEEFCEDVNTGWNFFELYLEILALLKWNRLYFMKVARKKVSGRFWLSFLPSWASQWIIAYPGKEGFS